MSRTDDLRAEHEVALVVAALEDANDAKPAREVCATCGHGAKPAKSAELRAAQVALRELRMVLRLPRDRDKAAIRGDDAEVARIDAALAELAQLKEN